MLLGRFVQCRSRSKSTLERLNGMRRGLRKQDADVERLFISHMKHQI